jgi:AGCS family alanine or glycine:cation symporter
VTQSWIVTLARRVASAGEFPICTSGSPIDNATTAKDQRSMDIAQLMSGFSNFIWGAPLALLLTGAGLLFTIMTLGIQTKALTHGIAVIRGKYDNPEDKGNISHFQALCTALSATIGLGNISGVAVAVATGGPGAVFWMWIVGFLGMATKFTTCSLASMYRHEDSTGTYRGGPMYFIELGLGRNATTWGMKLLAKVLAVSFAFLGMCACVGAGNMFQSNQVAKIFVNLVKQVSEDGITTDQQWYVQIGIGILLSLAASLVIIGGIQRIGNVASKLVPSMCLIYVGGAIYIILANITLVPAMFASIFEGAFTTQAGAGAFYGVAMKTTVMIGVKRACFSNEAGLGSAPIAHATAKTNEPIREGVVAAMGPFVDTIIICTMTALVILITNSHARGPVGSVESVSEQRLAETEDGTELVLDIHLTVDDDSIKRGEELCIHDPPEAEGGEADFLRLEVASVQDGQVVAFLVAEDSESGRKELAENRKRFDVGQDVFLFREGVNLTAWAFDQEISYFGTVFIPFAALMFAFSTIVSWGFYGETCTEYLFGEKALLPFKCVFVTMILVGTASMELDPVLDWSDAMLGLMLVPNMIGTILLAPRVMVATKDYFNRLAAGEFDEEVRRAAEAKRRAKGKR